jgi:hypothetical protein
MNMEHHSLRDQGQHRVITGSLPVAVAGPPETAASKVRTDHARIRMFVYKNRPGPAAKKVGMADRFVCRINSHRSASTEESQHSSLALPHTTHDNRAIHPQKTAADEHCLPDQGQE